MPRSLAGKTEVKMAIFVANIIDAPIACNILDRIKIVPEAANAHNALANVKKITPDTKTFFLPAMSPKRLNGTGNIADTRRKLLTIQLVEIAFMENSFAITGSARFIADAMNGIMTVAVQITSKTEFRYERV